jgi:squalene cyclase
MSHVLPICRRFPALRYVCALAGVVLSVVVVLSHSQAATALSLSALALTLWVCQSPALPNRTK